MLKLAISESDAKGRRCTNWATKTPTWDAIVAKLRAPRITGETMAEYKAMTKDQRDDLKDVGGFVGGVLDGPRRKKASVTHRTMLTLDADYATAQLLEDFGKLGLKGAIYSTHSHTPDKPRYRVLVPLEDLLPPAHYPALVNYIAGELGPEQFDPTTDEPHRLMYWPSKTTDTEYICRIYDGELFNGSQFLEAHPEWLDASLWQLSSKRTERLTDKAGDPREKNGLIGAFCRTYDIHRAIETFLPNVYEPASEGRYTYLEGSTSNGVVTYDDLWAYSHHATDPAGGQLMNAWDLVRTHLFKAADADVREGTPINQLPSQAAMTALVKDDEDVIEDLLIHQSEEAVASFRDDMAADDKWRGKLSVNEHGQVLNTIRNLVRILTHDPKLAGLIRYNTFTRRGEKAHGAPWPSIQPGAGLWTDKDTSGLKMYLESYGRFGADRVEDAWNLVSSANKYHPVADYLDSLTWDGTPRIDTLLIDYAGAEDSPYVRAATRAWMIGAVARAIEPGCRMQYMLILTGDQGIGKSTFFETLAVKQAWFSDRMPKMDGSKEAAEHLLGKWIIEVGELAGLRKSADEQEAIKAFVAARSDYYRAAYGRFPEDVPRSCVFGGTTNAVDILRDETGGRRFWPVAVREFSRGLPVDQVWAEAAFEYRMGAEPCLPPDIEIIATTVQDDHRELNAKTGLIEEFLEVLLPAGYETMSAERRQQWYAERDLPGVEERRIVCGLEVFMVLFGRNKADFSTKEQREIGSCLKSIRGWRACENQRRIFGFGKQRIFEKVCSCSTSVPKSVPPL